MTKREMFEAIKNVEGVKENAEMVEFLDKQIELVSRKRTSLTKAQKENAEVAERVYEYMVEVNGPVTAADVQAKFEVSNQKATALLRTLKNANKIVAEKEGKKTIYAIAD